MGVFNGLVAIVTGGAQGIGGAVVKQMLDEGARVAIFDLHPEGGDPRALKVTCDVGSTESVAAGVARVLEECGQLDIVINNAGIGAQGQVDANDDDEWARVLNVNVRSVARVTAAALPHLRQSKHAAVVNTSSIAATAGLPERVLYSASKGAIYSMTLAMAADHIREGIRVNAVCPGTAHTPWISNLLAKADDPDAELAALNARQPHGRLVSPDEVAGAICYLASPLSGSTAGVALAVDGGMQGLRLRPVQQD